MLKMVVKIKCPKKAYVQEGKNLWTIYLMYLLKMSGEE